MTLQNEREFLLGGRFCCVRGKKKKKKYVVGAYLIIYKTKRESNESAVKVSYRMKLIR